MKHDIFTVMLRKLKVVIARDGMTYTAKRILAFLIAKLPIQISFRYGKYSRLIFAPTLLTYAIFANRKTRHSDIDIIKKYTPTGGTVLDVGGNIGSVSIALAEHVGPSGKVYIFEPSPKFFSIITKNIVLNKYEDRVTAHQVAMGAQAGVVFLNESVNDDTTNHIARTGTEVPQATLDSYTLHFDKVDFLKIDVEGYELEVLRGATETIKKTKTLYIEFIPSQLERCGSKPQDVLDILNEYFVIYTLLNGNLQPFTFSQSKKDYPDLLCIKK